MIVTTSVLIDVDTVSFGFEDVIPLFTIPVSFKGVHIDLIVGLRININGQSSLALNCRVNAQFGVINNNEQVSHVSMNHSTNSGKQDFSAEIELSVNIKARGSVFMTPIYGIEGFYGKGVRTDSKMQQRCTSGCVVVSLHNVRGLHSDNNWGVLQFIQWKAENLGHGTVTGYRFIFSGEWLRACPHGDPSDPVESIENVPDHLSPDRPSLNRPSPDMPVITAPLPGAPPQDTPSGFNPFGQPVTLQEAQKTPGIYMKSGDLFVLIRPQWRTESSGYGGYRSISDVGVAFFGSMAEKTAILFNNDFQIPRIFNDAQLVLIGTTNVDIFEPFDTGWTIPHIVSLGVNSRRWVDTGHEHRELVNYKRGAFGDIDQRFESINNRNPLDYVDRMLYTREWWLLMCFQGLLTGAQGEEFTFCWWESTNLIERTYAADRRFFTVMGPDYHDAPPIPNYFEVRTEKGYFEIEFIEPPVGFYSISNSSRGNRIVEFVAP